MDLSNVAPELLSCTSMLLELNLSSRKVSKLGLGNTSLTPLQAIAIITAFDGNLALQEVAMSDLALSGIESRFFAKVFSGTKKLNLASAGLTALQVSQLLEVQSEEGSLEDLDLCANQLGMINAELMAMECGLL